MRQLMLAAAVATLAVFPALADDSDFSQLLQAKSLRCKIGPGALADWRYGTPDAPRIDQAAFASNPAERVMQFDSIDLKAGKARDIGNFKAAPESLALTNFSQER